jgi:hypothetical protein
VRCTREIEEMRALGLVELQRTRKRLQHAFRDPSRVAALEADVVVDTDPGEERDFFPAKSGNAPVVAIPGQTRLPWRDPGTPGGQELAYLVSSVQTARVAPLRAR